MVKLSGGQYGNALYKALDLHPDFRNVFYGCRAAVSNESPCDKVCEVNLSNFTNIALGYRHGCFCGSNQLPCFRGGRLRSRLEDLVRLFLCEGHRATHLEQLMEQSVQKIHEELQAREGLRCLGCCGACGQRRLRRSLEQCPIGMDILTEDMENPALRAYRRRVMNVMVERETSIRQRLKEECADHKTQLKSLEERRYQTADTLLVTQMQLQHERHENRKAETERDALKHELEEAKRELSGARKTEAECATVTKELEEMKWNLSLFLLENRKAKNEREGAERELEVMALEPSGAIRKKLKIGTAA
ncbi:hypothetical protein CC80DRAFT_505401 [Byssothecium circinans]|uniref:Uncharacterized protein n=1 Tax=Byssothecium circinans TaxID=147558 RepID=A0A6A5TRF1_9PLEO|nr:hypothetical protein CC80DRAFT_505401 [Byssothecium circinans]